MSTQPPNTDPASPSPGASTPAEGPRTNWFARHKVLTVLGAVVVVIVVASVAASLGARSAEPTSAAPTSAHEPSAPGSAPEPAPSEEEAPGIGSPVTSGDLEFTVTKVAEAGTHIGSDILGADAQGRYVTATVRVANVSKEPQTFVVSYVQLVDADGNVFDADSMATIYAGSNAKTWVATINPGNAVEGPIVFDLPAGTEPAAVAVKGGLFDTVVRIVLR